MTRLIIGKQRGFMGFQIQLLVIDQIIVSIMSAHSRTSRNLGISNVDEGLVKFMNNVVLH
jgi:hypothetical protein